VTGQLETLINTSPVACSQMCLTKLLNIYHQH